MDRSSSEPVLRNEDYYVPCHGVGDTGLQNKVVLGPFPKDKGIFSSRIATIIRQAEKVPGPGKYVAHEDWTLKKKSDMAKSERTYKPMNKTPAPSDYERKDVFTEVSNRGKDNVSTNRRVLGVKITKGKKRSFTDQAIAHGAKIPGPTDYHPVGQCSDRLEAKAAYVTNWSRQISVHAGKGTQEMPLLAPNHYQVQYSQFDERAPGYSIPKEKGANFLDKAVREKMMTIKGKKEPLPGPGAYFKTEFDVSKISRGTTHLQLRGLSRCALSGYF